MGDFVEAALAVLGLVAIYLVLVVIIAAIRNFFNGGAEGFEGVAEISTRDRCEVKATTLDEFEKLFNATTKVAARRGKQFFDNSKLVNMARGFAKEVKTEIELDLSEGNKNRYQAEIKEHIFSIRCKKCAEWNDVSTKTIAQFPHCDRCNQIMLNLTSKSQKYKILDYLAKNKDGIHPEVYCKILSTLYDV